MFAKQASKQSLRSCTHQIFETPVCRGWGRLGPLSVGLIVPLLMWLEGSVSSMCINPARAFGPALMTGVWDNHWVFWTAPFLGGIPAALIYTQLFSEKCATDLMSWITRNPIALYQQSLNLRQ